MDPLSKPVIDPKYLSSDKDLTVLSDGLKDARKVAMAMEKVHPGSGNYIYVCCAPFFLTLISWSGGV